MTHATKKLIRWALALILAVALLSAALANASGSAAQPITAEAQYARGRSAVLYVRCFYETGGLKATGSGFLIQTDGLALTAAHVVKNAASVTVRTAAGQEHVCTVLSCDTATDVAVLKLPEGTYPKLTLASSPPASGAVLRAMGYPTKDDMIITEGLAAAASGTVSEKERMLVTCDIVNGMSGGPIFDEYGKVVGLCSGSVRTMNGIHLSAKWEDLNAAVDAACKAQGGTT